MKITNEIFFKRLNTENKDNFALSELWYSFIALYWFSYETKLIFKSLSSGVQKSGITSWKQLYLMSCCHFYSMMLINERSMFKKTIDWCSRVNYADESQQSRSFSAGHQKGWTGEYPVNDWAEGRVSPRSRPAPVPCTAVNIRSHHRSNSLDSETKKEENNQCALTGVSHSQ